MGERRSARSIAGSSSNSATNSASHFRSKNNHYTSGPSPVATTTRTIASTTMADPNMANTFAHIVAKTCEAYTKYATAHTCSATRIITTLPTSRMHSRDLFIYHQA